MDQGIPKDVQEFLSRHIASVVQLELLLLLRATSPKAWSAGELARELRIEAAWAQDQSNELCERGVLACTKGGDTRYYYQPSDQKVGDVVRQLAEVYADRRVSLISFIYSRPPDQLKLFADAFRIRKENPDG